jgi:beta-lactamase class A
MPFSRGVARGLLLSWLALPLAWGIPFAWSAPPVELPVLVASDSWALLYDRVDPALQNRLEDRLQQNRTWTELVRRQKLAVGLVDLSRPDSALFARVNGRLMMYAASLPKIAILLAVCQAFEDGSLEETPQVLADLNDMIRFSGNRSAARLYSLVGFEKIRAVLTDPRYRLFDEERGGGIWVGKPYARTGRYHGDPLKGLVHAATVTQVCRFYYLLATGRLVSAQRSRQMLNILESPGLHHKFVHALRSLAPQARLYRKSGTWKIWHSDSVLVWGPQWRRYILVALVESPAGGRILENLVPAAEEVLEH